MGAPTQTQAWQQCVIAAKAAIHDNQDFEGRKIDPGRSLPPTETRGRDDDCKKDAHKNNGNLNISLNTQYSFLSSEIWNGLKALAREQNLPEWTAKMVAGDPVNTTENRPVGHVWLRSRDRQEVRDSLAHIKSFVETTRAQSQFTDIVHIGIGGSYLGPRLICESLKHLPRQFRMHFVSNIDGAAIEEILKHLNPATTLFLIASKSFTTHETMMNAVYARNWLGGLPTEDHMIALSSNGEAVKDFGIAEENMFPFWDWVGGRFSVWSSIGMPIALAYGFEVFEAFLNGGQAMDDHFIADPLNSLPAALALFGIWNRNFMGRPALAVLPYAQNLKYLADFLQQLDMESNGKSVDRDGHFITDYKTGPMIFGQSGTNGQHAFHQWLHQGSDIIPCEFIVVKNSAYEAEHHRILNANAAAQTKAFAEGRDSDNPHRFYQGQRPSVTLTLEDLSPQSMGQLIALYEHKIFTQGIIWNINSFDQFGVQLGKDLAKKILAQTV